MANRRICVSIGQKENAEVIGAMKVIEAAGNGDVVEIRLDYLANPDPAAFMNIIEKDLLFTCRPTWEGGLFEGAEARRIEIFKQALDLGAAYLDVELASKDTSRNEILAYRNAQKSRCRIIFSHHDFEASPPLEELVEIVHAMKEAGADMGKLVTTAIDSRDVLRIFNILEYARSIDFPMIAFCMGEIGAISRVATCDMGGFMTYCSAGDLPQTAAGQVSVGDMKTIFSLYP